jgi:hypothetical protein
MNQVQDDNHPGVRHNRWLISMMNEVERLTLIRLTVPVQRLTPIFIGVTVSTIYS